MKKLVLLSVVSFAFILVAASTSNAQGKAGAVVEVVRRVFEPKPLNVGEDKIVEKMNRDWERQREQPARPERDSPSRREPDRDCTRRGRRDN